MKKNILTVIFATMVMALSFTACRSATDANSDVTESAESKDDEKEADDDVFDNLEELFLNPTAKSGLKATYENLSSEDLTMTVTVKENTLIVTAQLLDMQYSDELVDAFQPVIDDMESIMLEQLDSLNSLVEDKTVTILVTYVDKNGKEIISKEFSK